MGDLGRVRADGAPGARVSAGIVKAGQYLCIHCGCAVSPRALDEGAHVVSLGSPRDARVELIWHSVDCAGDDAAHDIIADALALPDGAAGDALTYEAYVQVCDIAEQRHGVEGVRHAVRVLVDTRKPGFTLRTRARWGRLAPVEVREREHRRRNRERSR